MSNIQCIYCQEAKPVSAYTKVEHVIPQSFGRFENNFTLRRLVCDVCNQFLGDKLEIALARDTLEGQSRADFGIKKAEEYRSPGRSSRIQFTRAEGPFKGARAFPDYSEADGKSSVSRFRRWGFARKYRESTSISRSTKFPKRCPLRPAASICMLLGASGLWAVELLKYRRNFTRKGFYFSRLMRSLTNLRAHSTWCRAQSMTQFGVQ